MVFQQEISLLIRKRFIIFGKGTDSLTRQWVHEFTLWQSWQTSGCGGVYEGDWIWRWWLNMKTWDKWTRLNWVDSVKLSQMSVDQTNKQSKGSRVDSGQEECRLEGMEAGQPRDGRHIRSGCLSQFWCLSHSLSLFVCLFVWIQPK